MSTFPIISLNPISPATSPAAAPDNGKRFFIWTIGCQMNEADSAKVAATLQEVGYRRTDEENEARLAAAVPLKRQATVEDIAALFVWLSSEDSSYITGGTHNINGGSYIA